MKRHLSLFTLLLLLFLTDTLNAQWVQVNSGTNANLYKISAFDNNRLICASHSGNVLISDDFGETWQEIPVTYEKLTGIDCMQNRAIATSDNGLIFMSEDYGESWTENQNVYYKLRGAEFYKIDKAYVCGQGELIWESFDNFAYWNYNPYVFGDGYWFRDIAFSDEMNGYVVGDGGTAFKTPNAGYGWFLMNTKTTENLMSVSFPTTDTGYICGHNSIIIKTTNGGISWDDVLTTNIGDLRGTWFLTADTGYVCGWNGVIIHTFDGGASWTEEVSGVNTDLTKFYYIESVQRLVVIGHEGTIMYKDVITSTNDNLNSKKSEKLILAPNPAKNQIRFSIAFSGNEAGYMNIYTATGMIVEKIRIRNNAGYQTLDITSYNAGIYHVNVVGKDGKNFSGSFIKQ